jgi:hypothetical protein
MAEIGKIINKDIKTSLDNDVFRQIIVEDSDLSYISNATRKSIESYLDNNKDLNSSKDLWKNLIIDAICVLKVNDSREGLYDASIADKNMFIKYYDCIRKSSSYGINEMSNYFDDFIKFESVLYGTDEHYRDHVGHVLQVWAIGISLISNVSISLSNDYILDEEVDYHFELVGTAGKDANSKDELDKSIYSKISKSELWAMWTLIALCHDLGYPIEKATKINQQAKRIIEHFGNMNFIDLNYSFDVFNTFLVEKFLNIISSKVDNDKKILTIQSKYKDKFSKSLEDYKHGIFSSLLIFKNFTYFLETDFSQLQDSLSLEDLRQFYIRKEILKSIACHTCPKIYHLELNTLSFLLILCDELQEWDRPNFDEFRRYSEIKEPKVKLLEFIINDKQRIKVSMDYDLKFNEKFRKYIVYKRYRNIHNLMRNGKDDSQRKQRKIQFEWIIKFSDRKFELIFDSKNEFDLLKVKEFTRIAGNWNAGELIEIYNDKYEKEIKIIPE